MWLFSTLHCVALRCKATTDGSRDCTVPHSVSSYCTVQGLPELQCCPQPLAVTVMDQFYKHVPLYFYLHNEFCWVCVIFLVKGKKNCSSKRVTVARWLKDQWCLFTVNTLHAVMTLTTAHSTFIHSTVLQKISVNWPFIGKADWFPVCGLSWLIFL